MKKYLLAIMAPFLLIYTQCVGAVVQCEPDSYGVINVKSCGAQGDGRTDDTGAIQNAVNILKNNLNSTISSSGALYFPGGRYIIKSPLYLEEPKNSKWMNITVYGQGPQASQLISQNAGGILKINMQWRGGLVEIKSLGFIAGNGNGAAGDAVKIDLPVGGGRHNRSLIMRDLQISNEGNSYFVNGLNSTGLWRPFIDNVLMTYSEDKDQNLENPATNSCFSLVESFSPSISNVYCWNAKYGLNIKSTSRRGPEGLLITGSKFVNVNYGISVDYIGEEPEAFITNNHVNAFVRGISLKGKKYAFISNNLLYNPVTGSGAYEDVYLENCKLISIENNIFHQISKSNRTMIVLGRNNYGVSIVNNMFHAIGTAIKITDKGSVSTQVAGNRFFKFDPSELMELIKQDIIDNGYNTQQKDNIIEISPSGSLPQGDGSFNRQPSKRQFQRAR